MSEVPQHRIECGLPREARRSCESRVKLASLRYIGSPTVARRSCPEKSTSARCGEAMVDNLLRRLVGNTGFEPVTFTMSM